MANGNKRQLHPVHTQATSRVSSCVVPSVLVGPWSRKGEVGRIMCDKPGELVKFEFLTFFLTHCRRFASVGADHMGVRQPRGEAHQKNNVCRPTYRNK